MRSPQTSSGAGLIHAGAGTGLFLVQVSALIPGLLPFIALGAVITIVALLPLVVLGVVGGVLFAIPYGAVRLVTRRRRLHETT